jgi:hypothetical protein
VKFCGVFLFDKKAATDMEYKETLQIMQKDFVAHFFGWLRRRTGIFSH